MRRRRELTPALGLGVGLAVVLTLATGPSAASAGGDGADNGADAAADDTFRPGWELKYRELFDEEDLDIDMDEIPWKLDNYENVYDTISDDDGDAYWGEMGMGFGQAIRSFRTWEKTKEIGEDNWITVALTGRQQDLTSGKNQPERPGVFHVIEQPETGNIVAELRSDDPTAGAMIRNTNPMPAEYRMEYTVTRYEMGGERYDPETGEWSAWTEHPGFEYGDDGEYSIEPGTPRWNGFTLTDALGRENCKNQYPWPDSPTNAYTTPQCGEGNWNPLNYGGAGYNGLHALTVTDVQYPMPRNLHFWHYHRKVLMDQFATDPDRNNNGAVCNSETGVLTRMQETHRNGVNPWVAGRMGGYNSDGGYYEVGRMAGQSQRFFSDCNNSVPDPDHPGRMIYEDTTTNAPRAMAQSDPRFFPYIPYTFAVERSETGYTLEWSGMFQDVGWHTYRYYRPFILNNNPVWRYNAYPGDHYDGRYNGHAQSTTSEFQPDGTRAPSSTKRTWPDQWHADSAYPDFVMMGIEYTNSTEGWLQFDDVRLYEPADNRPPVSITAKANVDNWHGTQPQLDIEVINLEETVPNVDITVTTDFGTQTFTDVRPDAHPNARFKVNGPIPAGVAQVTATKGDQTYSVDVPYEGIDSLELTTEVSGRCFADRARMTYSVTNADDVAADDVTVTTPQGTRTFDSIAPGATVDVAIGTRFDTVPEGTFTVAATAGGEPVEYPFTKDVEYQFTAPPFACDD